MVGSRLNVHLYRDSFNTPWGFRLQGGKDLNQPLIVQRVFSNSPAEGELQRGDVILSVNNRDAAQLTHKQAQDLIKHGGGQVQLVVNRPPPGTHVSPLSPPIVTQKPRAPSLQSPSYETPPSRPLTITMVQRDVSHQPQYNPPYQTMQPLHVQPPASPQYQIQRQRSTQSQPPTTPIPTTPVPPWASQQFAPKKVSKLSKLGGGGLSFGTDYCTLPRRSSSAQYGGRVHTQSFSSDAQENVEGDRLATGPPPKVCSLRNLGGGGFDFGTSFGSGAATLPRRNIGRRLSQPPSMPSSAGYQPKKITLNKLGGGGPEFGSDFSHRGVDGYGQTAAQRYEPQSDKSVMLNRVQSSLDNIALSPRTPDVQSSSPFYQGYDPQPYQPAVQPYQPPPTQVFTPTGLLLENQRLQEQQDEGEAIVPVWERRKHFQQRGAVRTPANKPPPRVPKPQPGPTSYGNFGVDYSRQKSSNAGWRPAPAYKPTPAPASPASYSPAAVTYAPKPAPKPAPQYSPQAPASWQQQQPLDEEGTPAWRNTLKSTGVKPWEQETGYALPKDPVRSVPYSPQPGPHAGPFSPTPAPGADVGGSENGPKVVHLQYNSPMGLYSSQNVAETLHGQTQALSGQTTGSKPSQPATNDSGERDWSQSAVLRFINQEDSRVKPKQAPAVSPKPKVYSPGQQQQQQPFYQEVGVSDF
ncbi:LIM domain-binding protein 3-like isoform X2 [Physella acuta]|uniref:LIM domain-binding protein 3-like isoform X2 n=1 Tax=Physella acuta TaxID=109671 RepID=UPI0027DAC796|nr:LIM domain-binding protein 3-like isoform X2 [Physella acuta]